MKPLLIFFYAFFGVAMPIVFGFELGTQITERMGYSVITLMADEANEIIPLIDGKPPIDCPDGYRATATGYYDEKIHYRCLLIQESEDCLDSEFYVKGKMTCVSKTLDEECGDRYFLTSPCHVQQDIQQDTYIIEKSVKRPLDEGYTEQILFSSDSSMRVQLDCIEGYKRLYEITENKTQSRWFSCIPPDVIIVPNCTYWINEETGYCEIDSSDNSNYAQQNSIKVMKK